MVEHFQAFTRHKIGGRAKAMIVTGSRLEAVHDDVRLEYYRLPLHRYETRLHSMYQRGLRNLLLLRNLEMRNEPNPIAEHLDPAPDPWPVTLDPRTLAPGPRPRTRASAGPIVHNRAEVQQ